MRARREATGLLSGTQRLLFVLALVTFGLSSIYTSIALLTRVTPALFPGKDLLDGFARLPLGDLVNKLPVSSPGAESAFNERINLLILGVDQRPLGGDEATLPDDVRWNGRTDTILVATIDPLARTVSMLSFPRDMWVDIHPPAGGVYQDRINASFITGLDTGKSADAGAKQLQKDMKLDFGIDAKYYVLLDFSGVEKMINALGGVDIDIPPDLAVYDWYYSDDDQHAQTVNFPPGLQHLDGYHAVAFGRNRDPSDFARIKRQQLVITTAVRKALSTALLDDPVGLWNAYGSTVKTDMPLLTMVGYAPLLKDTQGRMNTFSLGDPVNGVPTMTGFVTDAGADVLSWNPDNVQYWLSQTFTKAQYSQATVEVRNGNGTAGSPRTAALGRYLAYSKGLPTVYFGPDQPAQQKTTITLYGTSKRQLAEDLAGWLGVDPLHHHLPPAACRPQHPRCPRRCGRRLQSPGLLTSRPIRAHSSPTVFHRRTNSSGS